MDPRSFDRLARSLAAPQTRRGLLGTLSALAAGLTGARVAGAQISQLSCGNQACASSPGACKPGCVCCLYANAVGQVINSRCRPPGTCAPGIQIGGTPTTTPAPTTPAPTTTTTSAPTTTTSAPTTTTTTTATPTTTAQPTTTTTTTTTAAPTTTTTTTTPPPCGGTTCSQNQVCLVNNSCAQACFPGVETCPSGCSCHPNQSVEGINRCTPNSPTCAEAPQTCTVTANCPQGYHCQVMPCGAQGTPVTRCVPLCPAG